MEIVPESGFILVPKSTNNLKIRKKTSVKKKTHFKKANLERFTQQQKSDDGGDDERNYYEQQQHRDSENSDFLADWMGIKLDGEDGAYNEIRDGKNMSFLGLLRHFADFVIMASLKEGQK